MKNQTKKEKLRARVQNGMSYFNVDLANILHRKYWNRNTPKTLHVKI